MGRKKKKPVKPWCWYCNREFDDDKILVQHQRAKHFKCPFCHKKLYSGPGLTVHCVQVHKENLDKIPEALPNRNSVDIDIYGMQGVPEEDIRQHERLKRGDDGSKSQDNNKKPPQQAKPQPQAVPQNPMAAMQAAMFQRAAGLGGGMPPPFPMPLGMPPGHPAGMPPMMPPPGFGPPPGFPHMPMIPGMMHPPPHLGFPPGMMPPSTMASHLGFPPPPHMGPVPSTSGAMPPPPPMSGVGHLIGVPPPNFPPPPPPPPPPMLPQNQEDNSSNRDHESANSATGTSRSNQNDRVDPYKSDHEQGDYNSGSQTSDFGGARPSPSATRTSSQNTISKPASLNPTAATSQSSSEMKGFIEIPGMKARIIHPNSELSLEEIRLSLTKYRDLIEKLPST